MMKRNGKSKEKPFEAQFFSTLAAAIWITAFILFIVIFDDDLSSIVGLGNVVGWEKWALCGIVLVIGLLLGGYISILSDKCLEKAGYGIKSLEKYGARVETDATTATFTLEGRNVIVDIIGINEDVGGEYGCVAMPYTRIRVEHTGKIPYVMELMNKKIRFFDEHAYMEWKKQLGFSYESIMWDWEMRIPEKIESRTNENMVAEWERCIYDTMVGAGLEGLLRIEPEQVYFLQKGEFLEGTYLKNAVDVLTSLAEKMEKI